MNIYFAGSIKGGRQDAELYQAIIEYLKRFGVVLTEHIGSSSVSNTGEQNLTPTEIYERDVAWVRESDVVVAEVTTPSLGVGYEIGLAESLGKKILCLFRTTPGRSLSSMILGNKRVVVREYQDLTDARMVIKDFVNQL